MADIIISGQGFYTIAAETPAGREFMELVDGSDAHGVAYCDDSGMAEDIADGAHEDGLIVEVNGQRYIGNGRCQIGEAS